MLNESCLFFVLQTVLHCISHHLSLCELVFRTKLKSH
jgi:hypothetical protein